MQTWQRRPFPPSHYAPDIPPALDELVMALLSVEPVRRPRNAHEVMQRLAACSGLEPDEPLAVSQAYLVTPTLVGRAGELSTVREKLAAAQLGRASALMLVAEPGLGRSRMLDACVLEAKTLGVHVLRTAADSASKEPFAAAQTLCAQLFESAPELARASLEHSGAPPGLFVHADGQPPSLELTQLTRPELQLALKRWFVAASRRRPLLIAVDDVERIDDASLALLAALAHGTEARGLALDRARGLAGDQLPELLDLRSTRQLTTAWDQTALLSELVSKEMREAHSVAARSACALQFLGRAERASAGRLFVWSDQTLTSVAEYGGLEETPALRSSAQEFFERMSTQPEQETALESPAADGGAREPSGEAVATRDHVRSPDGARDEALRFLWLECTHEGASYCMGVAVLAGSDSQSQVGAQLTTVVALQLLAGGAPSLRL
jgi:ABC-type transporter Mla MlaB component